MRTLHFLIWVQLILGLITQEAFPQSVRIAVAGDPELADLVDLTTAEISQLPNVSVLDRADLSKIGNEQDLEADSNDPTRLELIPADGLVLFRAAAAKSGTDDVLARLVAVKPGVVLREITLPHGADAAAQAKQLVQDFGPYWSKLAAIQKEKIQLISLLGLRFDIDTPESRDLERRFNILLSNRLSDEPDILVLERWHLNEAAFEKSLTAKASPFWSGSSLIDGALRLDSAADTMSVALRTRSRDGTESSINDSDRVANLAALVSRLADKIQKRPVSSAPWNPTAEATHFRELGEWCIHNQLFEEGAEAAGVSHSLGGHLAHGAMLRVKAYAQEAYPDALISLYSECDSYSSAGISPDSIPQRVAAATTAAEFMSDYLVRYKNVEHPVYNLEAPTRFCDQVLYNCLRTLLAAYDLNRAIDTTELRKAVRAMVDQIDKSNDPEMERCIALEDGTFYAGLWHDKPEDTLAYYRETFQTDTQNRPYILSLLFRAGEQHTPYLDGENIPKYLQSHLVAHPWIVSYDGRTTEDMRKLWQSFIAELAASPDPILQSDSFKLEILSNRTDAGFQEVWDRYLPFLKAHTDVITGPQGKDFVCGLDSLFYRLPISARPGLESLYTDLYKMHVHLPDEWVNEMNRLVNQNTPLDEAKRLLDGLNDYRNWYSGAQNKPDGESLRVIDEVARAIYFAKPELAPVQPANPDALAVTNLWCGPLGNRIQPIFPISLKTLFVEGKNVWFMTQGRPSKIFCVDSSTLQIVSSWDVPGDDPHDPQRKVFNGWSAIGVAPNWISAAVNGRVWVCARADKNWKQLDVPPNYYKPIWVNDQLYLVYDVEESAHALSDPAGLDSGLMRVSLPDAKVETLVSSRRVPPISNLDGKPLGIAEHLWLSSAGLTMAFNNQKFQVYAAPLGTNTWKEIYSHPVYCFSEISRTGLLVEKSLDSIGFGEIVLIDRDSTRVLLWNPYGVHQDGKEVAAEWNFAPELCCKLSGTMRGDDLCVLYTDKDRARTGLNDGNQSGLYYFTKGKKDGLKIPLHFDLTKLLDQKNYGRGFPPDGLHATDYGLVIGQMLNGFWVIPWSDIDAYRAKHEKS